MSPKEKTAPTRTRRSRGSLSEEEILNGAIALVKRDGLDGLSMPNLARHLGAGVMSLYWYFHSKDDLLGAMAEHTMHEVYARLPAVGDGPWEDEVTRLATAFYTELRRTPVFAQLLASRPRFLLSRPRALPVLAKRVDEELQVFQRVGVSATEAMGLHNILWAYALGFVLMQLGTDLKRGKPSTQRTLEASVARLDPAEFPTLRALSDVEAIVSVGNDGFEDFLRIFVAGMRSELAPPRSPGRRHPAKKRALRPTAN